MGRHNLKELENTARNNLFETGIISDIYETPISIFEVNDVKRYFSRVDDLELKIKYKERFFVLRGYSAVFTKKNGEK